jgi:hypothetical protein
MFSEIVKKAKSLEIIDGEHVSIDATKVDAYEAPQPKKKVIDDGNNPNWGMKRDTNGNNIRWFAWKIHIHSDSKSELPISIMVTPANVHDSVVATSLIRAYFEQYPSLKKPKFYALDSGYDAEATNISIIYDFNGIPIIAYNPRGSNAPPEGIVCTKFV